MIHRAMALAAILALTGCEQQPSLALGTWSNGQQTLTFGEDGSLVVRKTDSAGNTRGTWKNYGQSVTLAINGQETNCGVASQSPTHLILSRKNTIGAPNCGYAGAYWRMDLPENARTTVASYSCDVTAGKHGKLTYAPPFVVEADEKTGLICFGLTQDGCKVVGFGNAYADNVSLLQIYARNYGESYAVEKLSGALRLTLSQSNQCGSGGDGLPASCSFVGASDLGACTRRS